MKNIYTGSLGEIDDVDDFPPIRSAEKTVFHVGQSFADNPVPTFVCTVCGGSEFNVGKSDYATAIRCPNCGWESVIHDG